MTSGIEWSIAVDAGCSGEWHFHYDSRSWNFELRGGFMSAMWRFQLLTPLLFNNRVFFFFFFLLRTKLSLFITF